MTTELLSRITVFVVLCLAQALVLNHIHLFGVATPLLYVYMVLQFRRSYPRWAILLWCFLLGVVIDTFSNPPGVAAASLTFVGVLQPYYFELFLPQDAPEDMKPSLRNMGILKYLCYSSVLVVIFCLLFFTLETFNFFNWLQWIECVGGSTLLTLIFIITIEIVRKK